MNVIKNLNKCLFSQKSNQVKKKEKKKNNLDIGQLDFHRFATNCTCRESHCLHMQDVFEKPVSIYFEIRLNCFILVISNCTNIG